MSSDAYEDPLARKKSENVLSPVARQTKSSGSLGRPLSKSYYCAISEMSVAPPHTVSNSHSLLSDDRPAAAMQLVASRLHSRNCGAPSFPIQEPKAQHIL
jgi:hypothetical protein